MCATFFKNSMLEAMQALHQSVFAVDAYYANAYDAYEYDIPVIMYVIAPCLCT